MENLKENYNKIIELNKKNYEIKEKINNLVDKSTELYHKNYDQFTENEKTIKKYKNTMELNKLKIAILKNNMHYLFRNDFEGVKNQMIDFYENKKIGEKTKEKMQDIIKEYFKNNYNINIACWISFTANYNGPCGLEFNFYFLNEEGYKSYVLEYNEEFKIIFEKKSYNNYELSINYYHNIIEYVELKEIDKKAKELLKEYNKTVEKIEKLRLQQKELYHNFVDYIHGFIYNQLDIKTDLYIY